MRFRTAAAILCVLALISMQGFGKTRKTSSHSKQTKSAVSKTHKSSKSARRTTSRKTSKKTKSRSSRRSRTSRKRGQQTIESSRAREIQDALIRAKYLTGEPSGVWDQQTKSAMMRFQGDNGWQTKVVPDSRALIKLGLGPTYDDVINQRTSQITLPQTLQTDEARNGNADSRR